MTIHTISWFSLIVGIIALPATAAECPGGGKSLPTPKFFFEEKRIEPVQDKILNKLVFNRTITYFDLCTGKSEKIYYGKDSLRIDESHRKDMYYEIMGIAIAEGLGDTSRDLQIYVWNKRRYVCIIGGDSDRTGTCPYVITSIKEGQHVK